MAAERALSELADGSADGASLGRQAVAEVGHFTRAVDLSEVLLLAVFRRGLIVRHGIPPRC